MSDQLSGLSLNTTLKPSSKLPTTNIDRLEKLGDLTHMSIEAELNAATLAHEFSTVIAPWLPVKCYYRLYYLETTLVYLLNGNSIGFKHGGHKGVRKAISILINNNELVFSNVNISTQNTIRDIRAHKIAPGSNLSENFYLTHDCVLSVRKKVSDYLETDWKETKKISTYSTKASRSSRDNFYATNTLNLTDFFYWMRIKVNYKDMNYLDFPDAGTDDDALSYVKHYFKAYASYAEALKVLILDLRALRSM